MAKTYPIQSSFAAGEVTPKIYGRYDSPGYQSGLMSCLNMIVDSRGPVFKRRGLKHVLDIVGNDCRLFEFNYSREKTFIVVLTDLLITVSSSSSSTLGDELLSNPSFTGGLNAWNPVTTGNGTVTDNADDTISLDPTKGVTASHSAQVSQTVILPDPTADYVVRIAGDFKSPVATPLQLLVGTTGAGSFDLLSHDFVDNSSYYEFQMPAPMTSPVTVTIRGEGWNVGGTPATESILSGVSFTEFIPATATFTNVTPYPEIDLESIQAVMHPDGKSMYFTQYNHPVQLLTFDPVLEVWTYAAATFTAAPAEWVAGNYPNTSAFFQGRHWFSGTPDTPEALWGSKSGAYDNLTIGVNDDDAFKFTIAEHGLIVWLLSGRDMLVGTVLNEFILTSTAGVITPSDVQVEKQSSYGSAPIQTTLMGTEALFVSSDNTKLRSQWYQWTENGYLARDISYTNDHILQKRIRHMAYQREPEQFIWMSMDDGELIGCTYHRDGNDKPIYGWHRHRFDGVVLDCVALQAEDKTALIIAVLKTVNGTEKIHIMLTESEIQPAASRINAGVERDYVYLDDYTDFISDGVTLVQTGLDYLEGEEVQTVNDGAVETLKTVSSGQIALDNPGINISVGIPYIGSIKTLPLVTQAQAGTTAAWLKHRNKIVVRCLASAQPVINGQRQAERDPITPMNESQPITTGDFSVANLGHDELVTIDVSQDLPKPLNIIAIIGEVSQETL